MEYQPSDSQGCDYEKKHCSFHDGMGWLEYAAEFPSLPGKPSCSQLPEILQFFNRIHKKLIFSI